MERVEYEKKIKVYSANVNSLRARVFGNAVPSDKDLRIRLNRDEPHIACVQETKLDKSIIDSTVNIANYEIYRHDRNLNGGGVAIYARNQIEMKLEHLASDIDPPGFLNPPIEIIAGRWTVGQSPGLSLVFISAYLPPGASFISLFYRLCMFLIKNNLYMPNRTVLCGDLNLCHSETAPYAELMSNAIIGCFFCAKPTIFEPTHGNRILDQIWIPFTATVSRSYLENPLESKHKPVFVEFYFKKEDDEKFDESVVKKNQNHVCLLAQQALIKSIRSDYLVDKLKDYFERFQNYEERKVFHKKEFEDKEFVKKFIEEEWRLEFVDWWEGPRWAATVMLGLFFPMPFGRLPKWF